MASPVLVNRLLSLKCISTREAASCCHPSLMHSGSKSSGSRAAGLTPLANACQDGGSKSHTPVNSLAATTAACGVWRVRVVCQLMVQQICNSRVTLPHHRQTVGPTPQSQAPPETWASSQSFFSWSPTPKFTSRIWLRHSKMSLSCARAKGSTAKGWTHRSEQLARAPALSLRNGVDLTIIILPPIL